MNYNYLGSIAQRKMKFSSSVATVADEVKNLLFDAVTIYIPSSKAAANILNYASAPAPTLTTPSVFTCTVDNYKTIMTGDLLTQWATAFRDDTNIDLTVYLVVFLNSGGATEDAYWHVTKSNIAYDPLTNAFMMLNHISYFKVMFDEKYSGIPTTAVPAVVATKTVVSGTIANDTAAAITITAGDYNLSAGGKTYKLTLSADTPVAEGTTYGFTGLEADSTGPDSSLYVGCDMDVNGVLPAGLTASLSSFTQGKDAQDAYTKPSYFDLELCLSCLCRDDIKLSYNLAFIKTSFTDRAPTATDPCWARLKTKEEELEYVTVTKAGDISSMNAEERGKYFWGCLYQMDCVKNTWCLIHSEDLYLFAVIFNSWFANKNASGEYIGNKLSLLRLTGTKIKPFGYPSILNSAVNENDAAPDALGKTGFDYLDEKNIAYLSTISDNSEQDCAVSMSRSIDGTPLNAQMISKFVDYNCSMDCAEMITDKGTLVNPVLTNEAAYSQIQSIVALYLESFSQTGRISNITLTFPSFSAAKVGKTALEAASAWSATYIDDLDEVTVTGGITA